MFLAQVTFDLGSAFGWFKTLIALALVAIMVFTFVIPLIRSMFASGVIKSATIATNTAVTAAGTLLRKRDTGRSSDTLPPAGFAEHLSIIEAAAPNANPQIWWDYAKAEMTEAEVALAEAKLARQPEKTVLRSGTSST